ncbi:MAG: M48 family metallopeptidase [Myxococcota bacterium]|nr:M48 family metallopeptidase [Myxococcota bacterium]
MRRLAGLLGSGLALLGALACTPRLAHPPIDAERLDATRDAWIAEAMESMLADSTRVARVANRLRVAGVPVCGEHTAPLLGFYTARRISLASSIPFLEALYRHYDVTRTLTVTLVVPGSPAERAGLVGRERLLRVHDRRVRRAEQLLDAVAEAPETPPTLEIERGDVRETVTLDLEPACRFVVTLAPIDALATGRSDDGHAAIGRGLLEFTRDDHELAIAIAHELGHRILGGRYASYPEDELDADRLGLEITRLAGYDATRAPEFYERLAIEKPWLVIHDPDRSLGRIEEPIHGRLAERILRMREILAE